MSNQEVPSFKEAWRTVLVVAVKRIPGEWCAYIKGVPGENHERELADVKKWGGKLHEEVTGWS